MRDELMFGVIQIIMLMLEVYLAVSQEFVWWTMMIIIIHAALIIKYYETRTRGLK